MPEAYSWLIACEVLNTFSSTFTSDTCGHILDGLYILYLKPKQRDCTPTTYSDCSDRCKVKMSHGDFAKC